MNSFLLQNTFIADAKVSMTLKYMPNHYKTGGQTQNRMGAREQPRAAEYLPLLYRVGG